MNTDILNPEPLIKAVNRLRHLDDVIVTEIRRLESPAGLPRISARDITPTIASKHPEFAHEDIQARVQHQLRIRFVSR